MKFSWCWDLQDQSWHKRSVWTPVVPRVDPQLQTVSRTVAASLSSGRCTCQMVHWPAAEDRIKHYWCAGGWCVWRLHHMTHCLLQLMTWQPEAGRRLCLLPLGIQSVSHLLTSPEADLQSAPRGWRQCCPKEGRKQKMSNLVGERQV